MTVKYFLGIQSYANHDSGASIVQVNTKTKKIEYVCISEERLIRKKHPYSFPIHSINYCLNYFNLKNLNKIDYLISDWIKLKKWHRSGPSYNYSMFDYYKEKLKFDEKKIIQIDHHLAHAASVFYTSKFKESAILIVDGLGSDLETTSYFKGSGEKIKLIEKFKEQGIGTAYSAITNHILNFGTGGEGKTMGLAPYGKKNKNQIKMNYEFNGIKTDFSSFVKRNPLSDTLNQINSGYRPNPLKVEHKFCKNKNHLNKYFSGVAYDIQNLSEKTMVHLGKDIYQKVKSENICIAGGVGLNSVANKKLIDNSKFKNIFVFPACSDAGIPFGLAIWGAFNLVKNIKRKDFEFKNAYTGKEYRDEEVRNLLKKFKIKYEINKDEKTASLIKSGKIVGVCRGKSEYGPRALGNRSILADPRNPKMRDYLNIKVKHREVFRPFAPAILEEKNKEYFDLKQSSPYMLLVAKSHKARKIPSAIHYDKTARVQTVNKNQNLKFYNLIKEFYKQTNIPVLLNTSFNDAGEPMIETPLDALICFFNTKIDYLIINDLIINKKDNTKFSTKKLSNYRENIIELDKKNIHKNIMKKISKKEFLEKKRFFTKKAIYLSLFNSKDKLKKFIKKYNKKNKILIVGTNDHTFALNKLLKLTGNFDYFEFYKKNDYLIKNFKLNINKINNLKNIKKYDKIIISSYEYQTEIFNKLTKLYSKKNIYKIYDNSSRSLIDTVLYSKNKKINKIYTNGVKSDIS